MNVEGAIMMRRKKLRALAFACAKYLEVHYHVKRLFIIGSLVGGKIHDRSDIDLVVEGLQPELYMSALTELYDLLPQGTELNLIPYEDAFESLKEKASKEGELILA
jgi:predicted nucleotidyltransferase